MADYDPNMSDEEARKKIEDESWGGFMRKLFSIIDELIEDDARKTEIEATYGRDIVGKRAEQARNDDTVELN